MDTILLIFLAALSRLVPHVPDATAVGAIAIFSGARLPRRWGAFFIPFAAMAISDFFIDFGTGRAILTPIRIAVYASFAASMVLGRLLPARFSAARTASVALASSFSFFVVTNFAVWASSGMYPHSPAGVFRGYAAALPFFRNDLFGTLAWTGILFAAEAVARRHREKRRTALAVLTVAALVLPSSSRAQTLPPVAENVVVSASIAPEVEPSISASVTVIPREQIEKNGKTDVLELLREVPGVDVVQSGGAGTVASVFIRGATSFQTLVLIDGVRVNSPYGAGYDFSSLPAQNVERIEVVRGPFSALYGADAVGGVVSFLTRPASSTPSGRVTAAAGNRGFHEETLFATGGAGPFSLALSGRDVHDGGDSQVVAGTAVDNSAWRDRTGSAQFAWTPTDGFRAGLNVDRTFARTEIPSDGSAATPHRTTDFGQTVWTVPVRARLGDDNTLTGSLSEVDLHPTASDPDDASGFFASDTVAKTRGARAADSWSVSPQNTLSGAASWERSTVDSQGAFGPIIADRRISTWGIAGEDQWTFAGGRFKAVGGVRYDRHSQFGSATDPRVSLVWNVDSLDALRASYGTACRAPSIVDLDYPFYGNPDLQPERSRSYEVGFSRSPDPWRLDVALFRNDIRDLIQYDVVRQLPGNVGRARTEGVEASAVFSARSPLSGRLSYTYLRAVDETTGDPLVRRPRHRGALDLAWNARPWLVSASAIWVGRRADFEAGYPYGPTEDPSYLRLDARLEYRWRSVAPFVTLENALDRKYAEANGFPATRRRVSAGLIATF